MVESSGVRMQVRCMQGQHTGLTIEQVGVVLRWQAVDVKDVEQVKVLAMHITTDC